MTGVSESRIVRTYMTLAALYTLAASLIWSVNTLFLLGAGLSLSEVFIANALFSVGMVVFEIPTGVVADTLGRRVSYLLSVAILAGTTVMYVVAAEAGFGVIGFSIVSVVMGLGYGTREQFIQDEEKITTDNLKKLKVLMIHYVPDIEVIIVEVPHEEGLYGAKGMGQDPLNPVAPAISNAIYDAVGVRLDGPPYSAERIYLAMLEAGVVS